MDRQAFLSLNIFQMAATEDTKQIKVLISGKSYPLKVRTTDEKLVRQIAKEINEKIDQFQVTYPSREQKDCMAMSLLSYALDLHKIRLNPSVAIRQQQEKITTRLNDIDVLLDNLLQE